MRGLEGGAGIPASTAGSGRGMLGGGIMLRGGPTAGAVDAKGSGEAEEEANRLAADGGAIEDGMAEGGGIGPVPNSGAV